tara:strand:- start:235 stop:471 length:237 start_codon:yes stop_codon:yes gene_type:complete
MKKLTLNQRRLKEKKVRTLLSRTNNSLADMMTLQEGGFIMDNDTLRFMLKNNPHISKRFDDLQDRKFKLERLLWRFAQ